MRIKPRPVSPGSFKNVLLLLGLIIVSNMAFSQVRPPDSPPSSQVVGLNMKEFGDKAAKETTELDDYIHLIIDNKTSRDEAYKSIDQACLLFSSEEDRVEVSSLNTNEKNKYTIRDYLNRLQQHAGHYDAIKIDYAIVSYASHFKKGTDGNWHGVITLQQTFRGYVDGQVVYSDVTKKNVEIVAKRYDKETPNGTVAIWDVFLGDVGVVQTRRLKRL